MKVLKHITVVLVGMIFLISSSGFMIYKSSCSCTGEEQTSVFVRPETCETTYHQHHQHDQQEKEISCSAHECHECSDHTHDCGCETPQQFFFKLKDKAIDDEVHFIGVQSLELMVASSTLFDELQLQYVDINEHEYYNSSPPTVIKSFDFLIQIHQLKIPSIA
ncbi:hypothetical protein [uncultured Draconibacterium sp.]|uniref:hypothetical protein n=1 Tax=uncultured Draconibacterium sp. TaxID=1573823 RepID=UPI00321760BB